MLNCLSPVYQLLVKNHNIEKMCICLYIRGLQKKTFHFGSANSSKDSSRYKNCSLTRSEKAESR